MNAKRLHIHSLPLLTLSLAVSGVLAVTAAAVSSDSLLAAATRPTLKAESVAPASPAFNVSLNNRGSVEAPGASNQLEVPSADVAWAVDAVQAAALRLVLEQSGSTKR